MDNNDNQSLESMYNSSPEGPQIQETIEQSTPVEPTIVNQEPVVPEGPLTPREPATPQKPPKKTSPMKPVLIVLVIMMVVGGITMFAVQSIMNKFTKQSPSDIVEKTDDSTSNTTTPAEQNDVATGTGNELEVMILGTEQSVQEELFKKLSENYKGTKASYYSFDCGEIRERGMTIFGNENVIKTDKREYSILLLCDYDSSRKAAIVTNRAKNGAILVVSVKEKASTQIQGIAETLNKTGVGRVVVYLSNTDKASNSEITSAEKEMRNMLQKYGFDKDKTPITKNVSDLMKAADSWLVAQTIDEEDFLMPVEDIFTITGRGTVVTGRAEQGKIKVNDKVEIVGIDNKTQNATITGIEKNNAKTDNLTKNETGGIILSTNIERNDVKRGQVIAKPGTITAHKKFQTIAYFLTKEEGGRHTPFFAGYNPEFYFRTTDIKGKVTLPEGKEQVYSGEVVTLTVELEQPVAMKKSTKFVVRESGKTVAGGTVTKIIG